MNRFLWVEPQIQAFCKVRLAEDIRNMLDHLPKTLAATFEEIYRRIQSQEGRSPEIAKTVLMWVMCACRPLSSEELSTIISQSFGIEIGIDDLLPMCHNLLKLDEELDVVRFFHLSITEFLGNGTWFTLLEANTMATECCLSMLIDYNELGSSEPYVIDNWPIHLQLSRDHNNDQRMWDLFKVFIGSFEDPSGSYWAWADRVVGDFRAGTSGINWRNFMSPDTFPPVIAGHFGFFEEIRDLWEQQTWDIDQVGEFGQSLVYIAIRHESRSRCQCPRWRVWKCTTGSVCGGLPNDRPDSAGYRSQRQRPGRHVLECSAGSGCRG